ncbi:heparin lyase I family protein [Antrihabitans stalactiti]|uniref:Polysaccharide lyase n=1 Tax=Antrihabitans stalactiti TaxID=2584121 RepID=A0A848KCT0_9NOCA|nr:heparin lyase I family protein [Antrihabitans stalactiti]NMN96655.1 hypothetical protein [Antrihabitans stalactiti]
MSSQPHPVAFGRLVSSPRLRLLAVVAITVGIFIAISPKSAQSATIFAYETESMTWSPASAVSVVSDLAASGGSATKLNSSTTGSKSVLLGAGTAILLTAKGGTCITSPAIAVTIDGAKRTTISAGATTWTTYRIPVAITAGTHTIEFGWSPDWFWSFCGMGLYLDSVSLEGTAPITTTPQTTLASPTTTTTSPTTTAPTTTVAASAVPSFVGDYETGNFSQWPVCQSKVINDSCSNYNNANYSLMVQNSVKRQGSYAARFELRDGDIPSFGGAERTEVQGGPETGGKEGEEGWYSWSTQFTSTFPQNHATQGWGVVAQWHPASNNGSPPVSFNVDVADGQWGLKITKQSSPGVYVGSYVLWQQPLSPGVWHDIKMHIKWSAKDTIGFVEFWYNGVQQTFQTAPCVGMTKCMVRTLIPGVNGTYFKQGYYRDVAVQGTGILYHDGFRCARTEAGLGK